MSLTIRSIKNQSAFIKLYKKFIIGNEINDLNFLPYSYK